MRIIYVDDEEYMGIRFRMECESVPGVELLACFKNPIEAIKYVKGNHVDAAFLDVRMPEMTGLELADRLREIQSKMVIIFISAHDKYMKEALQDKNADYYILKPYSAADIASIMERSKLLSRRQQKNICIKTFGRFSVYVDGKYLTFNSKKAKEVFAILVDNMGNSVNAKVIWNTVYDEEYDHSKASKVRKAFLRLRSILEEAGIGNILIFDDGEYSLNTDDMDCDLFRFLDGDKTAINQYYGEYMSDYSWAETTNGMLMRMCSQDHRCFKRIEKED